MRAHEEIALEYHLAVMADCKSEIRLHWKDRKEEATAIRLNLYVLRLHQWAFDDLRQKIAGRDG